MKLFSGFLRFGAAARRVRLFCLADRVGKVNVFIGNLTKGVLKYVALLIIVLSAVQMIFGISVPFGEHSGKRFDDARRGADTLDTIKDSITAQRDRATALAEGGEAIADSIRGALDGRDTQRIIDSLMGRRNAAGLIPAEELEQISAEPEQGADSARTGRPAVDTASVLPYRNAGFKEIVHGTGKDSMIYDVRTNKVYIFKDGDVTYGEPNLKADYIELDATTKNIFARGYTDTLGVYNRPIFDDGEGGQPYPLDSINYNLETGKAKIKGIRTQDGDGYLLGEDVKMVDRNTFFLRNGKYTTCDLDEPHFYIRMTRAKVIANQKVLTGYAYIVAEGVPIYPLGIPEAFFPMAHGRSSGFIIPSFGEETSKGFFLRDGGYYFALSEHADLRLLGGIYTLGSWEASVMSRYIKRYTHQGNLQANFSQDIVGDEGSADYYKGNNLKLVWTHTQDPKFRPGSTFSASVNYQTSGYSNRSATTINDRVTTQTNSSIAYSKSWAGTPFSLSTNMQMSQNTQNDQMTFNFPNAVFNVSRINPLKRREAVGKQRWYEKISMSYTGTLRNSVTADTKNIFSNQTLKDMKYGIQHSIPITTSVNVLGYINLTPNANYTERWYFRKMEQDYDPVLQRATVVDTTYGFYRVYNYSTSLNASTTIYGMWDFSANQGWLNAIRHTITPTIGFSYTPDFGQPKYGFYKPVQTNASGDIGRYSPFANEAFGTAPSGRSGALTFSVAQTLEGKVRNKRDSSGVKKVKFIDNLSFSGSYNFMADSLKLSPIAVTFRATIPGLNNTGIQVNATFDPYMVDVSSGNPVRINKLRLPGRISTMSTSFGYSFNSKQSTDSHNHPAINSQFGSINPFQFDPDNPIDPAERRVMMTNTYYDFSIPWNISFSYSFSYNNNGLRKTTQQTLGFNGSVNLTPRMGISFSSGYDFVAKSLTVGTLTLSRDLHCWQFSFTCTPIGRYKSWSFNISARSPVLRDLKYDKRSNRYDNVFDN